MAEREEVLVDGQIASLDEVQRKYIAAVLRHMEGNRVAAASALGISLRGLQYIIARWRRQGHAVPESQHSRSRNLPWKRACSGQEGA